MIDSHHHLWQYSSSQYAWIGDSQEVLKRDFLLPELQQLASEYGIDGFVTVQARQSLEETYWLLELAEQSPLIRGVVGWLPLQHDQELPAAIELLQGNRWLKGVRHVIQDEQDDQFILDATFNHGIELISCTNWIYDILIYARHLPATIQFVDQHTSQQFVLDHIAKPTIHRSQFDRQWEHNVRQLALRPNINCKFSGIVTEVRDANWDIELIRPYFQVVLEAFGIRRLMFGSDWPVCLLRTEYGQWLQVVKALVAELSIAEQNLFWFENARRVYRLNEP